MSVDIVKLRGLLAAAAAHRIAGPKELFQFFAAAPELLDELERLRRLETAAIAWVLAPMGPRAIAARKDLVCLAHDARSAKAKETP